MTDITKPEGTPESFDDVGRPLAGMTARPGAVTDDFLWGMTLVFIWVWAAVVACVVWGVAS